MAGEGEVLSPFTAANDSDGTKTIPIPLVLGVLLVILAIFSLLLTISESTGTFDDAYTLTGEEAPIKDGLFWTQIWTSIILDSGLLVAGILLMRRRKKGIHFAWLVLGLQWLSMTIFTGFRSAGAAADPFLTTGLAAIIWLFCFGSCGVLLALPLFIPNNGMR